MKIFFYFYEPKKNFLSLSPLKKCKKCIKMYKIHFEKMNLKIKI